MDFTISISDSAEDFKRVQLAIDSFLETYGDCGVQFYEDEVPKDKEGLTVHGEYGTLDTLFAGVNTIKLTKWEHFDDARQLLHWNAVIFPVDHEETQS